MPSICMVWCIAVHERISLGKTMQLDRNLCVASYPGLKSGAIDEIIFSIYSPIYPGRGKTMSNHRLLPVV